jgi:hypothetical protein
MPDTFMEFPCRVCDNADIQWIRDENGKKWAEYCPNGCYHVIWDHNTKDDHGNSVEYLVSPSNLSKEEIEAEVAIKQLG